MAMTFTRLAPLASLLLIAACGGGSGSSTTVTEAGPNGLPFGAAGLVATQARFEQLEDTKMKAGGVKADNVLGGGTFANTSRDLTAEITLIDDDTIRLKLDGVTYFLDENGSSFDGSDGTMLVALTPGFAGGETSSIFFFRADGADAANGEFFESFLITGFETRTSDLPGGSVTYNGTAGILVYETDGTTATLETVLNDSEKAILGTAGDGDLRMTVAFGSGTVGGEITGTTEAAFGGGAIDLGISGTVSGNDISGTLSDDAGNADLTFTGGTFSGTFYGPDAEDVGGTFRAELGGATVAESTEAVGFFVGSR